MAELDDFETERGEVLHDQVQSAAFAFIDRPRAQLA